MTVPSRLETMGMHSSIDVGDFMVTRVPNGWLYRGAVNTTFVPDIRSIFEDVRDLIVTADMADTVPDFN